MIVVGNQREVNKARISNFLSRGVPFQLTETAIAVRSLFLPKVIQSEIIRKLNVNGR
jgi:hypothetical protein